MYIGRIKLLHRDCVISETSKKLEEQGLDIVLNLVLRDYSEGTYELRIYTRMPDGQVPSQEVVDTISDVFYSDHPSVHKVEIDDYGKGSLFVRCVDAAGSKGVIRYFMKDQNIASLKSIAVWKVRGGVEEYRIISSSEIHIKNVFEQVGKDKNIEVIDTKITPLAKIDFETHWDYLVPNTDDEKSRQEIIEKYNELVIEYLRLRFGASRSISKIDRLMDSFINLLMAKGLDALIILLRKILGI